MQRPNDPRQIRRAPRRPLTGAPKRAVRPMPPRKLPPHGRSGRR
jgi:hypothetical protein